MCKLTNRIRYLRTERGLTLVNLANNTGLAPNMISQYETGNREPSLKSWQMLADYFGVSVGYLQGVEENVTDAERQQRWHERERSFLKALRESYMLNGSWEDLAQTFKREWYEHEAEERCGISKVIKNGRIR
ncbi:helix-turn-helix transcriptional regulator [Ligilactobacillus faecis]|uniref:Helix-turn-helix transcriptional regulator n=1 Tax=Ligilactobacillus faecis TaxID=762833 RepID=A0ABV4DM71_9LACO